jgi:hypothetical protein
MGGVRRQLPGLFSTLPTTPRVPVVKGGGKVTLGGGGGGRQRCDAAALQRRGIAGVAAGVAQRCCCSCGALDAVAGSGVKEGFGPKLYLNPEP